MQTQAGQINRTPEENETLISLIRKIEFFMERKIKENDLVEISNCLKHEYHKKGNVVFDFGTTGEKFYIILAGSVSVQVPIKRKKQEKEQNDKEKQAAPIQTQDLGKLNPSVSEADRSHTSSRQNQTSRVSLERTTPNSPNFKKKEFNFNTRHQSVAHSEIRHLTSNNNVISNQQSNTFLNVVSKESLIIANNLRGSVEHDMNVQKIGSDPQSRQDFNIQKHITSQIEDAKMIKSQYSKNIGMVSGEMLKFAQSQDISEQISVDQNSTRQAYHNDSGSPTPRNKKAKNRVGTTQGGTPRRKNSQGEDIDDEVVMTEVVQFHQGKSFGELALITNKPRAARIKCLTDCHFAVMSKHEYNRCLAKIENKTRVMTIQFLSEIPFFTTWSTTQLGKILSSFSVIKFKRGAILFREGTPNEDIYIVKSGEFKGTRNILIRNTNNIEPVMQYLRGERTNKSLRSSFNSNMQNLTKNSNITNINQKKEQIQLFLFGKGQLFGEERFVRNQKVAPYTATCSSIEGEVLRISSIEFMRKFHNITDTMDIIEKITASKEEKMTQKQLDGLITIQKFQSNLLQRSKLQTQNDGQKDFNQEQKNKTMGQTQDYSSYFLKQSNEKRDALKQIVQGYQVVNTVQKLIRVEDQNEQNLTSLFVNQSMKTSYGTHRRFASNIEPQINEHERLSIIRNIQTAQAASPSNVMKREIITPSLNQNGKISTFRRKKENLKGTKVYLSSQLVDAIQSMNKEKSRVENERQERKDNLQKILQKSVVDENSVAIYHNDNDRTNNEFDLDYYSEDDDGSEQNERLSTYRSEIRTDKSINYKLGNALMMKSLNGFNNSVGNVSPKQTEIDDKSLFGDFYSRKASKKTLKSIVLNQKNKRQSINMHQEDIVSLPNRQFINSDGTQIKVLQAQHQEFSPLIKYLVNQRQSETRQSLPSRQNIIPNAFRPSFKQDSPINRSMQQRPKVQDKTVFMHVAETLQRGNILNVSRKSKHYYHNQSMLPTIRKF
eukprot:403375474